MRFRNPHLFLFFYILILHGCVATQSFPTVARSGDTITLAVGSPDGMTKSNTTAEFVSDVDSSTTPLIIRSIIRIRPDQTSKAALFDGFIDALDNYTVHSQWLAVLVIDLPEGLTVGEGRININSAASYGALPLGVNDIPVAIEIIEGAGVRNEFNYDNHFGNVGPGDLLALESLPQIVFKTPYMQWSQLLFAAAEVKVNIPLGSVQTTNMRVVADDFYTKNAQDQVQMSWSRVDDEVTVYFVSPHATMEPIQLRFSVVLTPGAQFSSAFPPSIQKVKLFNASGELMTVMDGGIPSIDQYSIGVEYND